MQMSMMTISFIHLFLLYSTSAESDTNQANIGGGTGFIIKCEDLTYLTCLTGKYSEKLQ
jgi:hypothetical protein